MIGTFIFHTALYPIPYEAFFASGHIPLNRHVPLNEAIKMVTTHAKQVSVVAIRALGRWAQASTEFWWNLTYTNNALYAIAYMQQRGLCYCPMSSGS